MLSEPCIMILESGCSEKARYVNLGLYKPLAITAQMRVMRAK